MKKSLIFVFALFALLFNARMCMAEVPHTLTDDEWTTLFSVMDSVQNKSDSSVWEAFQSVEYGGYGGKEYEGFKDEAKHQALIATFKHWLLKELTPYYPANLNNKEVLVNSKGQLNDIHDDKIFEPVYIPNCREKGFECLFLNISLRNKQSTDRSLPGYLITFNKERIIDAKVIIWGGVVNDAYKSWAEKQKKRVYRRSKSDHTWTSVEVGISYLVEQLYTSNPFDINAAAKGRIYFPVRADHDVWNNALTAYENAQWYFVVQPDGKIERLPQLFCNGAYPSAYIKEVGEYMTPECKSFIHAYDPY